MLLNNPNTVTVALESVTNELVKYEESVATKIGELAVVKNWSEINVQTEIAKKTKDLIDRVLILKKDWLQLTGLSELSEEDTLNTDQFIPVEERTTWVLLGDKIRVETEGGSTTYSNVVPGNLFVDLALKAFENIRSSGAGNINNGYVKTSHVLSVMKDTIKELSEYKSDSSVRIPVYVTFKVLVKEGLFEKIDAHKYRIPLNKQQDFFDFLEKVDNVTYSEAVRRLRNAKRTEMADALEKYNSSNQDRKGWDESVSDPDGDLYKQFGEEMQKVIWPYKY